MVYTMREKQNKKNKWAPFIENALKTLKPPEKMKMSDWAEKYRVLDSKSSAIPGPWRNTVTPYLVGIMDEFNNVQQRKLSL